MRFKQDFIEKVRQHSDLVEIISRYTDLKGYGTRFSGLCPFPSHIEKTPSFSVSVDQQLYHCFGCKKSGNVYHFVQELMGKSFVESVEYLADKASLPIDEGLERIVGQRHKTSQQYRQEKDVKKDQMKMNDFANNVFQSQLAQQEENSVVKRYCKSRGLSSDLIKTFGLGFASDDWSALVKTFEGKKLSLDVPAKLGLVKKRGGGGYYDVYRNRLMFPILDHDGACLGFGGRVLGDENPKYLNSPESEVFHKRKALYGLHISVKYIKSLQYTIVVEGYMDLIALYQVGIKNVCATLGTALTEQHTRALGRLSKKVLLLFDGDAAGKSAARRSLPLFLAEGIYTKALFLPEKLDPDDFIKKFGEQVLRDEIKNTKELLDMMIDEYMTGYKGDAGDKDVVLEKIIPLLAVMRNKRMRDFYIFDLSDRLNVPLDWLKKLVVAEKQDYRPSVLGDKTGSMAAKVSATVKEGLGLVDLSSCDGHELSILNLCIGKEEFLQKVLEKEGYKQFSDHKILKLFESLALEYRQNPSNFDILRGFLVSKVSSPEQLFFQDKESWSQMDEGTRAQLFRDCMIRIKERALNREKQRLKSSLKGAGPEEGREKLERIMNIQYKIRQLKDLEF